MEGLVEHLQNELVFYFGIGALLILGCGIAIGYAIWGKK